MHQAHPLQAFSDRWQATCASCGWCGRLCKTEAGAQRSADRHNTEATARDQRVHQYLYGPKAQRQAAL